MLIWTSKYIMTLTVSHAKQDNYGNYGHAWINFSTLCSSVRCCFVEPRNSIVWKWEKTLYNIIIIMIAIRFKTQPLLLSAMCCNHEEGHWEVVVADMRGGDHVVGKKNIIFILEQDKLCNAIYNIWW